MEDGSNDLHYKSLALSLLEVCCSSSLRMFFKFFEDSSNLKGFRLKLFGALEAWSIEFQWFRAFWSLWRLLSLIPIELQILGEGFKGISLNVFHVFFRQNFSKTLMSWKNCVEWEEVCPLFIVASKDESHFNWSHWK